VKEGIVSAKVSKTLEVLRRRAGLSQTELAELVGRSQPEISNYERGLEIPVDTAFDLFHILFERLEGQDCQPSGVLKELVPSDLSRPWETVVSEFLGR
jgi:transcriptional regulator with XRE-family HTH domain